MLVSQEITQTVIGAAIEVHKALGPGLLESAYEECLCYELDMRGLQFKRQLPLPVVYKNVKLDCGYRLDLIVERSVLLELKSVEQVLPIHEAQLLTYLKLTKLNVGLLITSMCHSCAKALSEKFFDAPCLRASVVRYPTYRRSTRSTCAP